MGTVAEASPGAPGAQSLRRALGILRILASGQESGVRLTDIVGETGLNRPTVHRMLRVLIEEGAVEQDPATRRYKVGQEVSLLGLARPGRLPIRTVAAPYLQSLAEELGDTVFLTIRVGFDSICVDRRTGSFPIKVLAIEVGARRPLGVGVAGLVLLASLPEEEAAEIVRANQRRLRAHQLGAGRLLDRARVARELGYAYADPGLVAGTRAVAVAVHGPGHEVAASIALAAVAERLAPSRLAAVVSAMRTQADLVTRRLAAVERSHRRP